MSGQVSAPENSQRRMAAKKDSEFDRTCLFRSLGETINLVVGEGENKKSLIVHQNFLCTASPFFEAACRQEWLAKDRIIVMPEDDHYAVSTMIYWLYQGRICFPKDIDRNDGESLWNFLIHLYLLGDKYQIVGLRNHTLDAILVAFESKSLNIEQTAIIYENTIDMSSKLRYLWVSLLGDGYCALAWSLKVMHEKLTYEQFYDFVRTNLDLDMAQPMKGFEYVSTQSIPHTDFCKLFHTHENPDTLCESRVPIDEL